MLIRAQRAMFKTAYLVDNEHFQAVLNKLHAHAADTLRAARAVQSTAH
jgi:hypothetical protein